MLSTTRLLSTPMNQIHCWSEPEQHPMSRMFLTRIGGVGIFFMEAAVLFFKTAEVGAVCGMEGLVSTCKGAVKLFPDLRHVEWINDHAKVGSFVELLKESFHEIAQLIKGLVSTLFLGIVFSPESNFKYHLQLNLVFDDLAEKSHRKRAAKLQEELLKAEITEARNARFAELESAQTKAKQIKLDAYLVNTRLAELLKV